MWSVSGNGKHAANQFISLNTIIRGEPSDGIVEIEISHWLLWLWNSWDLCLCLCVWVPGERMDTQSQVLDRLRAAFQSGVTLPEDFRQAQLTKLTAMIKENEELILSALHKDLAKVQDHCHVTRVTAPTRAAYNYLTVPHGRRAWLWVLYAALLSGRSLTCNRENKYFTKLLWKISNKLLPHIQTLSIRLAIAFKSR